MQTAVDFADESDALHQIIDARATKTGAQVFEVKTDFNQWSIDDVLQHLHYFNVMADLSLTDPEKFKADYASFSQLRESGKGMVGATDQMLDGLRGAPLLTRWRDYYQDMASRWQNVDPKTRVQWVGPDMSVRSSITARLMETWAHGQEVYDIFGLERENQDRIKNVAVIGINTFGWTHKNRSEPIPDAMPHVVLTAPSGETWSWGEASEQEKISGPAEDFCMVVTQTRNIADTRLSVTGSVATHWMKYAQCFAGAPKDPPAAGTRSRRNI
jgi:uncharacterized protein (TIGR03084 family)